MRDARRHWTIHVSGDNQGEWVCGAVRIRIRRHDYQAAKALIRAAGSLGPQGLSRRLDAGQVTDYRAKDGKIAPQPATLCWLITFTSIASIGGTLCESRMPSET